MQLFSSCLKAPKASQLALRLQWTMKIRQIAQKMMLKRSQNRADWTNFCPAGTGRKNVCLRYSAYRRAEVNVANTYREISMFNVLSIVSGKNRHIMIRRLLTNLDLFLKATLAVLVWKGGKETKDWRDLGLYWWGWRMEDFQIYRYNRDIWFF